MTDEKTIGTAEELLCQEKESFCQKYVELDLSCLMPCMDATGLKAYREAYNLSEDVTEPAVRSMYKELMKDDDIVDRIREIYKESFNQIEIDFGWGIGKALHNLSILATSADKDSDKLRAIGMLNEIKGISKPAVVDEKKGDTIDEFFKKIGIGKES